MKNKNLLSGFFSLVLGLSFLSMSMLAQAGDQQNRAGSTDKNKASGLNLNWTSMGPNNAAGRTRGILFDNRDASGLTIYAGSVTGGIWKSTNLGLTWHAMNTGSSEVLRVTSLVQTSSGVIYAGTGESYCDEGQFIGTGLYRSDDGINFQVIPSTSPTPNDPNSEWAYILKLAINTTTGRLFAATNTGLKYSDDGNTWTMAKPGYCVDVKVGSDGTVLTAVNDSAYIAVNGDLGNFRNMSTGGTTGLPIQNVGWIEMAIAPSNPDILYACCADASVSDMMGVYRSEDKGLTWSVIFPYNNTYFPLNKRGCYALTLSVLPNDPNRILLGGSDLWIGTQYQPTGYFDWQMISYGGYPEIVPFYLPFYVHNIVFRPNDPAQLVIATDKGVSIGTVASGLITYQLDIKNYVTSQINTLAITKEKNWVMGGGESVGTQMIGTNHPNDPRNGSEIWIDTGGGDDGGNGGYCEWSMINPNTVMISRRGITTEPFRRSEDLGVTVSPTFTGTLAFAAADILPTHLWESFDFEQTRDSVKFIAKDSAIVAGTVLTVLSYNAKFPFQYIVPVTIPKGDSIMIPDVVQSRFFITAADGIYMSKDVLNFGKDPTWFRLASVGSSDPLTHMAMTDNLNYLWASTSNSKLVRISNLAEAYDSATANNFSSACVVKTDVFTSAKLPFLNGRYVTSVAIDPNNANNVVVTLGNNGNSEYVYMTNNALDSIPTFRSIQGNLPAMPVYCALIEMTDGSHVILGTEFGIFSTTDVTVTSPVWETDYANLGNVPVMMIKQQTNKGIHDYYPMLNWGAIYIATYGSGIFIDTTYYTPLGIAPVTAQGKASGVLQVMPNPASGMVTVSYQLDSQVNPVLSMYDLTGRTVLTRNLGNQQAGTHTTTVDMSGYQGGTYILRLNWGSGNAYGKVIRIR